MKNLFYFCAALLCLSLAFHFGYATARAQAPGNPIVAALSPGIVVAANGDVYANANLISLSNAGPWSLASNVFSSGTTPARQESWGQLKARYAPSHAPTSQTPTDH